MVTDVINHSIATNTCNLYRLIHIIHEMLLRFNDTSLKRIMINDIIT